MKKYYLIFMLSGLCLSNLVNCQVDKNNKCSEIELKIIPTLWHQQAAEYRALCYQAYNLASERINASATDDLHGKPRAVIVDCDETVLDNSPLYARLIEEDREYSNTEWKMWTDLFSAKAVPGAAEFLQLAHEKGITVFYISNRDTSEIRSTLINILNLGFPDACKSNMLFRSNTGSKEDRRQTVAKDYDVVLYIGDNLNDFMDIFRQKNSEERSKLVDDYTEEWGKKFILLPNNIYGDWEDALYNYSYRLTPSQKDSMRIQLLEGY